MIRKHTPGRPVGAGPGSWFAGVHVLVRLAELVFFRRKRLRDQDLELGHGVADIGRVAEYAAFLDRL